jgi:hypothetical protein
VLWFVLFIVLVLCVVVRAVHRFSFMCYGSCCSSLYFYVLWFVLFIALVLCVVVRAVHRFSFMCCVHIKLKR